MMTDIQIIFSAEFLRRIRSRPFIIGMTIGTLALLAMIKLPTLLGSLVSGSDHAIVTGEPKLAARAASLLAHEVRSVILLPNATITPELLKANGATSAISVSANAGGLAVVVYARDPGTVPTERVKRALAPLQLELATRLSAERVKKISEFPLVIKPVASHFTSTDQADAARGIGFTLIMFLYVLILVNSQLVTSSVAEEKTSRIAELLVATVDPSALLAGKILAGAALALVQMIVWIGVGVIAGGQGTSEAVAAGSAGNPQIFSLAGLFDIITPSVVIAFFAFFILGYLQVTTLMASLASLVNRTEDLGAISGPLVIPIVGALIIAMTAMQTPDATFAVVTSMIPIVSPFVMFARIAVSNVPVWQIVLSLAINFAGLYVITVLGGKIYRVGMLLYGRPPKLSQVWNVIRS